MRRRRAARCLLRADLALDDGNLTGATAALEEARSLDADAEEIAALERRRIALAVSKVATPAPAVVTPGTIFGPGASLTKTPDPSDGEPRTASRPRWRKGVLIAGAFLGVAGATLSTYYWIKTGTVRERPLPASSSSVPIATAGLPGPTRKPTLRVVRETIAAPVDTPQLVGDLPALPPFPAPPIAEPESESAPVVLALNRPEPAALPDLPDVRKSDMRLDDRTSALPPEAPARSAVNSPPPVVDLSASPPPAVRSEPAPPPVDDSDVVRSVLARYELAYNKLDASAASAVWPAVDRGALARAFNGLASQRLNLGACDVNVAAAVANATCSGTATWVPKIGGGIRTEARRWSFELRKSESGWEIQSARVR